MTGRNFYSTHQWTNGAISTVERLDDASLSIRLQDEKENMLTDVVLGEYEALCLAHSILSVLTHNDDVNEELKDEQ